MEPFKTSYLIDGNITVEFYPNDKTYAILNENDDPFIVDAPAEYLRSLANGILDVVAVHNPVTAPSEG